MINKILKSPSDSILASKKFKNNIVIIYVFPSHVLDTKEAPEKSLTEDKI